MKNQSEKIRKFLLEQTPRHPRDIVPFAIKKFVVTPTTIHRHVNRLIAEGKLIKTGRTRGARYQLATEQNKRLTLSLREPVAEDQVWKNHLEPDFRNLPENIKRIIFYGFTEILNNAIEHSEGTQVEIQTDWDIERISIQIMDNGIGIYTKLQRAFHLDSLRESVLKLTQGKTTTDPEKHTGEGIFFTSRAFNRFGLVADGLAYLRDNHADQQGDWTLETRDFGIEREKGTRVSMEIGYAAGQELAALFNRYSDPVTKQFDSTELCVELSKSGEETLISRSQAKRLLSGAEKFKNIVLDFNGVNTVGQAFADEVFRVFKNLHPGIEISYIRANEDVRFMIERSLQR